VAIVAERFHLNPISVAEDLLDDPTDIAEMCAILLTYNEAKRAFENAKKASDLSRWEGNPIMKSVMDNALALAAED
jgi:hypothetical protein